MCVARGTSQVALREPLLDSEEEQLGAARKLGMQPRDDTGVVTVELESELVAQPATGRRSLERPVVWQVARKYASKLEMFLQHFALSS